jgi:hypothetical protein
MKIGANCYINTNSSQKTSQRKTAYSQAVFAAPEAQHHNRWHVAALDTSRRHLFKLF